MKTIIALAALASIFLFSGTAMAFDELISNDTPYIKQSGDVGINGAIMWRTASKFYDSGSNSQDLVNDMSSMSIPLKGKYGINEFVQTFAIINIIMSDDGVDSNTGIGDIWLGAKWAVRPDGLFTIRGALDLPTGFDKKGLGNPGGYGLDIGFMSGKISGPINLNGQFGLRYNAESTDTNILPGICVYLAGKVGYSFTEQLLGHAGLEFMNWDDSKINGVNASNSGINWLEVRVGPDYTFNESIMLRLDATYDIMGKNTPKSTGIIFCIDYGYEN